LAIKTVSVFLKPNFGTDIQQVVTNLHTYLSRKKVTICLDLAHETRVLKFLKPSKYINFTELKKDLYESDLIITLGGDGTLLGACRNMNRKSPPVFGINMGKLGFITEFSKHEFFEELENVFKNRYELTDVDQYQADVIRKGKKVFRGYFLNDGVFTQSEISRMITLDVSSGPEKIYDISGDGLIVSTPIGSTAYSLAAGGPIIHPNLKGFVLTPICPHSLNYRPIVVSDKREITIKSSKKQDNLKLTLDGQVVVNLEPGDTAIIKKRSGHIVKFIKNPHKNFFQTLKEKFTYGRR
jgi:NAD+ kinase